MPPRLLIVSFSVCPAPDRHGVGLLNVIKALASRHSVDALTLRPTSGAGGGELPFVEKFMKTRMLRVPVGHGTLAEKVEAFGRAIRRQLEGEEYDVIHLRSAWGGQAVVDSLQGQSGRFVYEVARSIEGEPRAADADLAARLAEEEQCCLGRADVVLVPTTIARHHLLEERGVDPHRVFVVPPGVDVDHFDWEEESGGVDRVLYAGQIAGGRGVRLLAGAVGKVRESRPVKLMLAGSIEEAFRPALDESLAEANLGGDVELLGPIDHDDMPRVISQATVCAAPASPDAALRPLAGFPTKLLEYMACRRAVVAPRGTSVEEAIEDQQDGLLFEPGDADELAAAILKLLEDEPLRHALAESGYRRVRQEFPASATRRRLLEAYANLLPSEKWLPPGKSAPSIDGLPASPDTTARRLSPFAREWAEISGVIVVEERDFETEPISLDPSESETTGRTLVEIDPADVQAIEAAAPNMPVAADATVPVVIDATVPIAVPIVTELLVELPAEQTVPIAVEPPPEPWLEPTPPIEPAVELFIEAIDFEEAGEARDATIEPDGAKSAPLPPEPEPLEEEKTRPGPLHPRHPSS